MRKAILCVGSLSRTIVWCRAIRSTTTFVNVIAAVLGESLSDTLWSWARIHHVINSCNISHSMGENASVLSQSNHWRREKNVSKSNAMWSCAIFHLLGFETQTDLHITSSMVRHAAWLLSHFQARTADGKTACARKVEKTTSLLCHLLLNGSCGNIRRSSLRS